MAMIFNAAGPERPKLPTQFNPYKNQESSGFDAEHSGQLIEAFERVKNGTH